jgi:DNA-directed RNA polymerase specialized sigma24 family protein
MDDHEKRRRRIIKAALAFGLPHAEAEDAASHAAIKFFEGYGLKQSPYHTVVDYLRSQGYRGKASYFKKHVEIGDHYDESTVALEATDESHLLSIVADLFSGLDTECRRTLILHLVWGLSRNEIAFINGCTLTAVDTIIRRAKRQLLKNVPE